jgi:hypothetical protein|nr:MAG TPA: hypothetical protein [Caudoviricetes sp.]
MEIELTRAAKKSLAVLYKEYRQRINAGMKKAQAISFENCSEDILESRNELKAAGLVKVDILGNIQLTDKAIIFMEGKAWDTIKEWLSFGAQFIP